MPKGISKPSRPRKAASKKDPPARRGRPKVVTDYRIFLAARVPRDMHEAVMKVMSDRGEKVQDLMIRLLAKWLERQAEPVKRKA